jgi:hypothetical protein
MINRGKPKCSDKNCSSTTLSTINAILSALGLKRVLRVEIWSLCAYLHLWVNISGFLYAPKFNPLTYSRVESSRVCRVRSATRIFNPLTYSRVESVEFVPQQEYSHAFLRLIWKAFSVNILLIYWHAMTSKSVMPLVTFISDPGALDFGEFRHEHNQA